MRWARFEQNGTPTYGVVEGDEIIPVRGSPFDSLGADIATPEAVEREAADARGATDILRRGPELCGARARSRGKDSA